MKLPAPVQLGETETTPRAAGTITYHKGGRRTERLGDQRRPAHFLGAILKEKPCANGPLYGNPYLPRDFFYRPTLFFLFTHKRLSGSYSRTKTTKGGPEYGNPTSHTTGKEGAKHKQSYPPTRFFREVAQRTSSASWDCQTHPTLPVVTGRPKAPQRRERTWETAPKGPSRFFRSAYVENHRQTGPRSRGFASERDSHRSLESS